MIELYTFQVAKVEAIGDMAAKPPSGATEMEKTWTGIGIGLSVVTLMILLYMCTVSHVTGCPRAECCHLNSTPIQV